MLYRIPEDERWVIEKIGEFDRVVGPGLFFRTPIVDSIREKVSTREQQIQLFSQPMKLDFRNGSATPKNAYVFVRILNGNQCQAEDVYKLVYNPPTEWRKAVKDLVENAVRSFLSGLTVEEGLEMGRLGYNLLEKTPSGEECLPSPKVNELKTTLANWGLELLRITLGDLDLDPALLRSREELFHKQRQRDMALLEKEIRAEQDMGAYLQSWAKAEGITIKELQTRIAKSSKLSKEAREIALALTERRMSLDGHAFMEILVRGGTTLEGLVTLFKKFSGSGGGGLSSRREEKKDRDDEPPPGFSVRDIRIT